MLYQYSKCQLLQIFVGWLSNGGGGTYVIVVVMVAAPAVTTFTNPRDVKEDNWNGAGAATTYHSYSTSPRKSEELHKLRSDVRESNKLTDSTICRGVVKLSVFKIVSREKLVLDLQLCHFLSNARKIQ